LQQLAYTLYSKAEGSGSKPFNAAKLPFEEIKKLLDGEAPSGELPAPVPFAEVADRAALMARLDGEFNSLRANVNSQARLQEQQADVLHDLTMMNVLMTVMVDPSYDRADDPRYVEFARVLVGLQTEALEAARDGQFEPFSAAIGKINATCNECHLQFRTQSE
jgi:hypothetical protein